MSPGGAGRRRAADSPVRGVRAAARHRAVCILVLAVLACITLPSGPLPAMVSTAEAQVLPSPPDATVEPVAFAALAGWDSDDHADAFRVFLRTCARAVAATPDLRPALAMPPALVAACRAGLSAGPLHEVAARAFFERWFQPLAIRPLQGNRQGFLTGYYEPEIAGSLARSDAFPVAVLGRPADLATFPAGETPPSLDPALAAARRTPDGFELFPDRAAIWDGALDGQGLELLYVPDRVELFMAQVQGSARIRLQDGSVRRLVYAGRNGLPYTSIGRVIVAEGHMSVEEMTLARLKAWLRTHPADAERIMRLNRSYIFFSLGEGLDPSEGPIGAASVPLVPLRSIAVDRTLWSYGLPFWIAADLPLGPGGEVTPFARLMIAQDTGSAILGPARADLFLGSGLEAGDRAGLIRHPGQFTVLWPRGEPLP